VSGRRFRAAPPGRVCGPLRSNLNLVVMVTFPRNGARASPTSSALVNGIKDQCAATGALVMFVGGTTSSIARSALRLRG